MKKEDFDLSKPFMVKLSETDTQITYARNAPNDSIGDQAFEWDIDGEKFKVTINMDAFNSLKAEQIMYNIAMSQMSDIIKEEYTKVINGNYEENKQPEDSPSGVQSSGILLSKGDIESTDSEQSERHREGVANELRSKLILGAGTGSNYGFI